MGDTTIIAWTDHTFNPWIGCQRISPGCQHCYAETLTKNRMGRALWGPTAPRQPTSATYWKQPRKWHLEALAGRHRRRVFCGSLCDWAEEHPTAAALRPELFRVIRATPALDWQLLTKRADRIASCLPPDWGAGYENVWLGVSIESAEYAWRADYLCHVPAAIRFISYEPALGPLAEVLELSGIQWVIVGGESGSGFRPMPLEWARAMREKCAQQGVAFFFKQSSHRFTERGILLDGVVARAYPPALRYAETAF